MSGTKFRLEKVIFFAQKMCLLYYISQLITIFITNFRILKTVCLGHPVLFLQLYIKWSIFYNPVKSDMWDVSTNKQWLSIGFFGSQLSLTDLVESKMANIERNWYWWVIINYRLFCFSVFPSFSYLIQSSII